MEYLARTKFKAIKKNTDDRGQTKKFVHEDFQDKIYDKGQSIRTAQEDSDNESFDEIIKFFKRKRQQDKQHRYQQRFILPRVKSKCALYF